MKDYLVFVTKFIKKNEQAPPFEEGRVYKATDDGDWMNIRVGQKEYLVDRHHQSGDLFDAEIVQITSENHVNFEYTKEDAELVIGAIVTPMIKQAQEDYTEKQNEMLSGLGSDMADICMQDTDMAEAICGLVSHINKTTEFTGFGTLDLSPISRYSYAGKGYNMGNGMMYLKRYLDKGRKMDIYRAHVCLLNELIRLANEEQQA